MSRSQPRSGIELAGQVARAVLSCTLALAAPQSRAESVRPDFDITNGSVAALAKLGDTLYLGGSFSWVGPPSGCALEADWSTGAVVTEFPRILGEIRAVLPDGEGGWFIAGSFAEVAHQPRRNLAHVLADHTLSPWTADTDGIVTGLAMQGDTLFVCGGFNTIGGIPRARIASVDVSTGAVTSWSPGLLGTASAIAVDCGVVYTGTFEVSAWNAITGQWLWSTPQSNGTVLALASRGSTLYVGGLFTTFDGQTRNRIAALDAATGALADWNPSASYTVRALAAGPGRCYVGGEFSVVGGRLHSGGFATLDSVSGQAIGWDAQLQHGVVSALAVTDSAICLGGVFSSAGGQPRKNFAALSVASGLALPTAPDPNARVWAIGASGDRLLLGGLFTGYGGVARANLAAIDVITGKVLDWRPDPNARVKALAAHDTVVVVSGDFTSIGGAPRTRLAALGAVSGQATSWMPLVDAGVNAIALRPPVAYLGGPFNTVQGQLRSKLAAIRLDTAQLEPWNPGCPGSVLSLALGESTLFVGGTFAVLAGQPRGSVGELSLATGLPTPWNQTDGANGSVLAMAPRGSDLRLGGTFWTLNGQPRNYLGSIDARSGAVSSWNPGGSGIVFAVASVGNTVLVGGTFGSIGGVSRPNLAALDGASGQLKDWPSGANGTVNAILVSGSRVFVGGAFTGVAGEPQAGIAELSGATLEVFPDSPPSHRSLAVTISPTPWRGDGKLSFSLPSASRATARVFDLLGRERVAIDLGHVPAGPHHLALDVGRLEPGVYYVRISSEDATGGTTLVLLR